MLNARQALQFSHSQIAEVGRDELLIALEGEVVAAAREGATSATYTLPADKFFTSQTAQGIRNYLRQLDYRTVRIECGPDTYSISFVW